MTFTLYHWPYGAFTQCTIPLTVWTLRRKEQNRNPPITCIMKDAKTTAQPHPPSGGVGRLDRLTASAPSSSGWSGITSHFPLLLVLFPLLMVEDLLIGSLLDVSNDAGEVATYGSCCVSPFPVPAVKSDDAFSSVCSMVFALSKTFLVNCAHYT